MPMWNLGWGFGNFTGTQREKEQFLNSTHPGKEQTHIFIGPVSGGSESSFKRKVYAPAKHFYRNIELYHLVGCFFPFDEPVL